MKRIFLLTMILLLSTMACGDSGKDEAEPAVEPAAEADESATAASEAGATEGEAEPAEGEGAEGEAAEGEGAEGIILIAADRRI